MAKGKNLNPADAQRKAERKKELKKNKAERQKTRDFALVKKDTSNLQEDIERLEKAEADEVISPSQKTQLSTLRAELVRINKKKDEYVAEHPEHKKLVFRGHHRKPEEGEVESGEAKKKERKVFDKHGIPRHPERSVYFDPVMNPFGVPPPGMPYMERPLRPDEMDSQAEDDSDEYEGGSDDSIIMPTGPPPSAKGGQESPDEPVEDATDDIPMPQGHPPSKLPPVPPPPLSPFDSSQPIHTPPFPNNLFHPPLPSQDFSLAPPVRFPPFLPHPFTHCLLPPPPPGFPTSSPSSSSHHSGQGSLAPNSRPQSNSSIQDPLASIPHQTFQAYRAQKIYALPEKAMKGVIGDEVSSNPTHTQVSSSADAGTISAPAQLRDFKKESTAFVPSSLKKRKPGYVTSSSGNRSLSRVNAAPDADQPGDQSRVDESMTAKPDLLGALKPNFPAAAGGPEDIDTVKKRRLYLPVAKKGKDDYEKFIEEMGDILGT